MTKTITRQQIAGSQGEAFVRERAHDMGFLFNPYGQPEAGIDGLLELRDPATHRRSGGFLNGSLVTRLKMPPFIVTLGTWSIIGALNTFYSQSETIRSHDLEAYAPFLQMMGVTFNVDGARIMLGTFLLIALAIVAWYVLNRTGYGRHIYATGDDPEAARLAGINTEHILLSVYVLAGLIAAMAGWAIIGRVGAISPTAGENANLDSITAVVIGGTSLFGGRGSIVGTLIGALIVGVFRSAVSLAGLDVLWQEFAIGVLIIIAVALDQWIRRVSA